MVENYKPIGRIMTEEQFKTAEVIMEQVKRLRSFEWFLDRKGWGFTLVIIDQDGNRRDAEGSVNEMLLPWIHYGIEKSIETLKDQMGEL